MCVRTQVLLFTTTTRHTASQVGETGEPSDIFLSFFCLVRVCVCV